MKGFDKELAAEHIRNVALNTYRFDMEPGTQLKSGSGHPFHNKLKYRINPNENDREVDFQVLYKYLRKEVPSSTNKVSYYSRVIVRRLIIKPIERRKKRNSQSRCTK